MGLSGYDALMTFTCGCTDYHLADCPLVSPPVDDFDPGDPYDDDWGYYDDEPGCDDGCATGTRIVEGSAMGVHVTATRFDCDGCEGEGDHEYASWVSIDVMPHDWSLEWPHSTLDRRTRHRLRHMRFSH